MNTRLYGLWGSRSGQFLTSGGKVIVHTNRAELEYLCPSTPVREIRGISLEETIPFQFVPGNENIRFPLSRSEFKCQR